MYVRSLHHIPYLKLMDTKLLLKLANRWIYTLSLPRYRLGLIDTLTENHQQALLTDFRHITFSDCFMRGYVSTTQHQQQDILTIVFQTGALTTLATSMFQQVDLLFCLRAPRPRYVYPRTLGVSPVPVIHSTELHI